jgi:hypothetical protein
MNHRIKAALVVAATALAVAGLGPVTAVAHADTLIAGALVSSGCLNVAPPGVQRVGGFGSFSGPVDCNAPFNVVPTLCAVGAAGTTPVAGVCDATFSGDYVNLVCGSGTASGTTVLTGPFNDTIHFDVVLVAGQGVLTGSSSLGTYAGVVDILPTGGDCVNGVTQFRFTVVAGGVAN